MQAIQDIFGDKISVGIAQVALILGEQEDTVYRWVRRGRIPDCKVIDFAAATKKATEVKAVDALEVLRMNAPMKKRGWPLGKKRKAKRARR
jgi:hypothetical protein